VAEAEGAGLTAVEAVVATGTMVDPRMEVQPMTGYMVQIFLGDAAHGGVEYYSSYAVAATLFVMTLVLTLLGAKIRKRFRQAYD
jgi:phosphate transport system permease protein